MERRMGWVVLAPAGWVGGSVVGMVIWKLQVQGTDQSLALQPKDSGSSSLGECMHVCVSVNEYDRSVIFGSQPGVQARAN